jgi:spore germination protein YaaH
MPLNLIFRTPKTRRLVSAWMVQQTADEAVASVTRFQDTFDQVIFMCGGVKADGSHPTDWPLKERRDLASRMRDMGISVLNDYGGSWKEAGAAVARSPRGIQDVVQRMVEECDAVGADGVDIDFEHWPAEGRFVFTEFIRQLSEALHARNKMLSICVYALSAEARREVGIGFWDTSVLGNYADHLRAMTYDLYCPPSLYVGPTSTAPWGRDTMSYMATQVPRHKIVMGLPTYSVDWDMNDPTQSRQVNDCQWIAAREKESPIGRGWCYYWDVHLIRYTDEKGHAHLLWVSDARSTRSHLVTVDSLDLAGVCFWVLGGEDPAIWDAVRDHFRR